MVINNNNHKNRSVRGTRRRVRVGDKFDSVFFLDIKFYRVENGKSSYVSNPY